MFSAARRLLGRVRDRRSAQQPTETDVASDSATASTRSTGGADQPDRTDRNSTTGTTPSDTFVGRASGDETDVGQSGAERRAEHEPGQHPPN